VWSRPTIRVVTLVTGALRTFRLDELPSCGTCCRGKMNLVARPEQPICPSLPINRRLWRSLPGKAGITGWHNEPPVIGVSDTCGSNSALDLDTFARQSRWRPQDHASHGAGDAVAVRFCCRPSLRWRLPHRVRLPRQQISTTPRVRERSPLPTLFTASARGSPRPPSLPPHSARSPTPMPPPKITLSTVRLTGAPGERHCRRHSSDRSSHRHSLCRPRSRANPP